MDTSNQSAAPVDASAPSGAPAAQPASAVPAHAPSVTHAGSVGEALSNLMSYVPGFAGYKSVEDRRIADKQLRAVIGERLAKIKGRLDGLMDAASRSGNLESLPLIDQSGRRLEKLVDRMRFADYGYAAVFDRVQMGEPELLRIYQYDTGIMTELGAFDDAASGCEQSANDLDRLRGALAKLDALTAEFDRRFDARKHLFDGLPTP
jgi:hypothetical protein